MPEEEQRGPAEEETGGILRGGYGSQPPPESVKEQQAPDDSGNSPPAGVGEQFVVRVRMTVAGIIRQKIFAGEMFWNHPFKAADPVAERGLYGEIGRPVPERNTRFSRPEQSRDVGCRKKEKEADRSQQNQKQGAPLRHGFQQQSQHAGRGDGGKKRGE